MKSCITTVVIPHPAVTVAVSAVAVALTTTAAALAAADNTPFRRKPSQSETTLFFYVRYKSQEQP